MNRSGTSGCDPFGDSEKALLESVYSFQFLFNVSTLAAFVNSCVPKTKAWWLLQTVATVETAIVWENRQKYFEVGIS